MSLVSREPHATRETITLSLVWMLVILTVQPWSSTADGSTATDSGGSLKGVVLLGCVGLLTLVIGRWTRLQVAPLVVVYGLYGTVMVAASVALGFPAETVLRAARISLAMLVPALLWPLVRDNPARMIYAHLAAHAVLAATVLAGLVLMPSRAWRTTTGAGGDRLTGVFLPMLPPRVGEIGAVVVGLTVLTVLAGRLPARFGIPLTVGGAVIIALSRTRTSALALVIALVVAFAVAWGTSLGRRGLATGLLLAVGAIPMLPGITSWLTRAQSAEQLASLSGRATVWEHVAEAELTTSEVLWGHGLGEKRVRLRRGEGDINVMAIDNAWLGAYWEAGLVSLVLIVVAVLTVVYAAMTARTVYLRATCTFIVVMVLVSTLSESGLSDVSSQTMALVAAATAAHADRRRAHVGTGTAAAATTAAA